MNQLKLISCLLVIVILSACSILESDSNSSQIIGEWEWLYSTGGFTGETITPDSADVPNRHFVFRSNFTFSFFRADTFVTSGKYSFRKKDDETVISYDSGKENLFSNQRVQFQGNDTLILADECYDCYINYYTRDE